MTLKAVFDTQDAIPEAARGLYVEKEGKFHLAVEGMVTKATLDTFRENNITLKRQMDELNARFDGIDPEKARQLAIDAAKIRDKQLIEAGKVDELVAERTSTMKNDYEKTLKTERDTAAAMKKQLEGLLIDGAIREAAIKAGVRATAVDDVLLRGRQTFRLVDGKAVPMDGEKVIFGKSGEAMPITEWVSGLSENAPHLFEASQGGGARGNGGGGGAVGANQVRASDHKTILANVDKISSGQMQIIPG